MAEARRSARLNVPRSMRPPRAPQHDHDGRARQRATSERLWRILLLTPHPTLRETSRWVELDELGQINSAMSAAARPAPSVSTVRYAVGWPISSAMAAAITSGVAVSKSM